MFKQDVGFYLGQERADGFSGFVSENNLFLSLEIEAGITPDQGRELTAFIKEKISTIKIENLHQFDSFISDLIKERNLPTGFSLASGYLKENIFYLKTIGQGRIYIRRKNKLAVLVKNEETASGYIEENDIFIFTFDKFMGLLGEEAGLNKRFDHHPIAEIIDEITADLQTHDDHGTAALFLQLKNIEEGEPVADFFEQPEKKLSISSLNDFYRRFGQQKTLTFIVVFILGVILFWSVGLGYVRRSRENNQKEINLTKDLISQKLDQAEQVAFLNMPSALSLIAQSKAEVAKLKKTVDNNNNSQVKDLEKLISDEENKILKKEDKKFSEIFDLTVDNKDAKGEKLYLNGDQLLILDKGNGVLFNLSLEKKSLDKDQFSAIKRSNLIAADVDKKYFYVSGEGIYRVVAGKADKVITNDKDWGNIIDLALFNGNIYLLDQGKDEIWKYLGTEDGFGGKNSYFASGQAIDLSVINSLAVDGSIYLAGDSVMVKFTSGLRDEFKVNLPDDKVNLAKIFTSKDLSKVYGWDKDNGTVYVMEKNGNYQEQINSKILPQALDIVVYKNIVFAIKGSKIYKIE